MKAFSAVMGKDGGETLLHKALGQLLPVPLQDSEEH